MGERLVDTFVLIKRYELDRWNAELAKVTEWERREYAHHL
jgi:glutamine synthetase